MNIFSTAYPDAKPSDIIEWARGLKVNGGKTSFDPDFTPQIVEPIRAMADADTRIGTLIKPVQVGGSTAGEVVAAYWAAFGSGLLQLNWEDDQKAEDRWKDRVLPVLESCADIKRSGHRFEELICEARYPNVTVRCQGVFNEKSLDSDTVPLQINEEVHSWKPGFLSKARRRQTRVWNSKAFDISNAGTVGDQLHSAYEDGTQEQWEVNCPKCGGWHEMHFRFNPNKPELGGLRWDSGGCKMESNRFNYNKLEKTIRYEMPCGHSVRDFAAERRTLKGRYSAPKNEGAHISHRSWNFEGVACDAIKWLTLIQEWHGSIRAMKVGDIEPMRRFVTERECRFWSNDLLPYSGTIIYNSALKKNRAGMPNAIMRTAKFDWQAGYKAKGELEHYWGIIMDVDIDANSQLVWEGKVESDAELLAELDAHEVPRVNSWIDCTGVQKKRILQFCYQNGMNAVSLDQSRQQGFLHPDKIRRFYSTGKPIYRELNTIPVHEPIRKRNMKTGEFSEVPHPEEPTVVELHKAGLLQNYFDIRNMKAAVTLQNPKATAADYIRIEIPDDVSEDFKKMLESWEVVPGHRGNAKDESVDGFRPRSNFDHQLMTMAYHCFELEWKLHPQHEMSLLGARRASLGPPTIGERQTQGNQ